MSRVEKFEVMLFSPTGVCVSEAGLTATACNVKNHESGLRTVEFVSTKGVSFEISLGQGWTFVAKEVK